VKREHDSIHDARDDNDGRTIFKKPKSSSNIPELETGHGARNEVKQMSNLPTRPTGTLPTMSQKNSNLNARQSSSPAITIHGNAPPKLNPLLIPTSALQAAVFEDKDGCSLFVAQPNLYNSSLPVCTAQDVVNGLHEQKRSHPPGTDYQPLPTPTKVQHNLFGFKVTWPTPADVDRVRDIPIQLHGLKYKFQSSCSSRSNGILTKSRTGHQAVVIAALVKDFGENQVAIGEMHYRGVFTSKYWVRLLQLPRLSLSGKTIKFKTLSKKNFGIGSFYVPKPEICNSSEEPSCEPCNDCFIIPIKDPKLCSSFL
jgi:hypothetical protein